MKPFSWIKVGSNLKLTLIEEEKVISEDNRVAEICESYFEAIVEKLGINSKYMSEEPASDESVTDIIRKFENHPNIIIIEANHLGHLSPSAVELKDIYRETDLVDPSKAIQQNNIPIKIIKASRDIFSEFIF